MRHTDGKNTGAKTWSIKHDAPTIGTIFNLLNMSDMLNLGYTSVVNSNSVLRLFYLFGVFKGAYVKMSK